MCLTDSSQSVVVVSQEEHSLPDGAFAFVGADESSDATWTTSFQEVSLPLCDAPVTLSFCNVIQP